MAWGAAAAAGASILGNVLDKTVFAPKGGMGAEEARNTRYLDMITHLRSIVEGAKRAGIHPLAALGSSGVGGFAMPVSSYGGSAGSFGLGDAIGSGLGAIGDALYEQDQDRRDREERAGLEKARQRERALDILRSKEVTPEVRLQRENMALQNDLLRMDIARSRTALAEARAKALGATNGKSMTDALGITYTPPGGRASAQQMQDEYGDIVENVYGIGNWMQDLWSARSPSWWPESISFEAPATSGKVPKSVHMGVPIY